MTKNAWMVGMLALALAACGDDGRTDAGGGDAGRQDSGGGDTDGGGGDTDGGGGDTDGGGGDTDGGSGDTDGGSGDTDGGGSAFMALGACDAEGDYVTGDTVTIGSGSSYSPPCLRVTAGDTVTMPGAAIHPLSRSLVSGSPGNPIPVGSTAATVDVTFPTAGFYPYFCTVHGSDSATGPTGMAGVIWVE